MEAPQPISSLFRSRPIPRTDSVESLQTLKDETQTYVKAVEDGAPPSSLRELLTERVILAGGNYAFLSLVDIAFRAIQPLFYSTPIELGGLGMSPSLIGRILSVFGILNGFTQVFFFARVHDAIGSKRTFLIGILASLPIFASFPLINSMARMEGLSTTVWAGVWFQVVASLSMSFSYGKHTLSDHII